MSSLYEFLDAKAPQYRQIGDRLHPKRHALTTDAAARLYKKSPDAGASLCFMGHALMENRNGLILDAALTPAEGHAERMAALIIVEPFADCPMRVTLGADRGYDAADFVNGLLSMSVAPTLRPPEAISSA